MAFSIERYAYVCPHRFGITTDPNSGSSSQSSLYLIFVLVTPEQFYLSQGLPIRQILQLSLESSSFCLGINHIDNTLFGWSMVFWFERISKYCAPMLYWYFRPTLRVIYFCGGVFSSIILNIHFL